MGMGREPEAALLSTNMTVSEESAVALVEREKERERER